LHSYKGEGKIVLYAIKDKGQEDENVSSWMAESES